MDLTRGNASCFPFTGVRIVDFGHFVAGPYASVALGDLGATVVKVEPPGGDPMREVATSAFPTANRGKRSIALDLKHQDAAVVVDRACDWADVVMHNFRPGVAPRLGLDARTLRARRPRLIVIESSAYGPSGPKAGLPGFNSLLEAASGILVRGAGAGNPPRGSRLFQVDYATGVLGAVAAACALLRRERSGEGASLWLSLYDTAVYLLSEIVEDDTGALHGAEPLDRQVRGFGPDQSLYQAADGWLAVVAPTEIAARAMTATLGLEFESPRAQWGDAESEAIADAISQRPVSDLVQCLRREGVWAEVCREDARASLIADSRLRERGTILSSETTDLGQRIDVGLGATLGNGRSGSDRSRVPALAADGHGVLSEWGFTESEIASLMKSGAVRGRAGEEVDERA